MPKKGLKILLFFFFVAKGQRNWNFKHLELQLKFGPNLHCKAKCLDGFDKFQNSKFQFENQNSYCVNCESKGPNHAETADLKRRGGKRGSWPPDIPTPPFTVIPPHNFSQCVTAKWSEEQIPHFNFHGLYTCFCENMCTGSSVHECISTYIISCVFFLNTYL